MDALNGHKKIISINLALCLVTAALTYGATMATISNRISAVEEWQAEYNVHVLPLREQFVKFLGELPGMRQDISDLQGEIRALRQEIWEDRLCREGRGK